MLQKLLFKPGVNRENTRYTTEGGFYDCDKIRFRQGTPEKIGGWNRISAATFLGLCRSLWAWVTLGGLNLLGVGTNKKFYIENGGAYYDTTPLSSTSALGSDPYATNTATNTGTTTTVVVTDAADNFSTGMYVTLSPSKTVNGVVISGEYEITVLTTTTYSISVAGTAGATGSGGGTGVYAAYQVAPGPEYAVPLTGWGAGAWGTGAWGVGSSSTDSLRLWNQTNFGQNLIFGPRGSRAYYWDAAIGIQPASFTVTIASPAVFSTTLNLANGTAIVLQTTGSLPTGLTPGTVYYVTNVSGTTFNVSVTYGGANVNTSGTQSGSHSISNRGIALSSLAGAADVPLYQNLLTVSDTSRFVLFFGTNDIGSTSLDPMLVRWSDQENPAVWTPAITNQAGSLRLSHGSQIITAVQTRQEVVTFTDTAVYSLQYLGPPYIWGSQLLGDNTSIVSANAATQASGVVFWMGVDKFYRYDGRVQTLRCDLRQYIFSNFNVQQAQQVFSGTNEGFNEVWWFYCSQDSTTVDRYVVYNYGEDIWYYGTLARTAWLDSGIRPLPVAATYSNNIVNHEEGVDDNETVVPTAIEAFIASSEFDIGDGHNFGFVWRILPDITFRGSTASSPAVTMTLLPLQNSGSGYNSPASEGGVDFASVQQSVRGTAITVEQFTGQVNIRVRGRQMAFKCESAQLGTTWQLGAPRIDIKPDGRRGNT